LLWLRRIKYFPENLFIISQESPEKAKNRAFLFAIIDALY
jgi:hypothetical protein